MKAAPQLLLATPNGPEYVDATNLQLEVVAGLAIHLWPHGDCVRITHAATGKWIADFGNFAAARRAARIITTGSLWDRVKPCVAPAHLPFLRKLREFWRRGWYREQNAAIRDAQVAA